MTLFSARPTMSDSCVLPLFEASDAARIAARLYALEGPLKALHGERDINFLITSERGRFVFKIANAEESVQMLDCQHRVFERIAAQRVFPRVACALKSVDGNEIETVTDARGQQHYCRVLPFLEGRIWSEFEISSPVLLHNLGASLAALDRALEGFSHAGLARPLLWNMETTGVALESYKPLLRDAEDLRLVEHFEQGYLQRVLPLAAQLRRAVIHNDANRENVLVDDSGSEVISVIDFGDMIETWRVLEPAIAATYAMHDQPDPLASAAALVAGYHRVLELSEMEIELLFDLIGMRLCMSLCICAHQQRLQPDNAYLSIDQQQTRELLNQLQPLTHLQARAQMLDACAPG
jgi:Ser/Thr protein kinase RdoA (MazF antagonist)